MSRFVFFGLLALVIYGGWGCSPSGRQAPSCHLPTGFTEDSLDFEAGKEGQRNIALAVTADAETALVRTAGEADDAADDMALWADRRDAQRSVLLGTNKKGGIGFYRLDGSELGFLPCGRINNIDVAYGIAWGTEVVDVVGCTNRTTQCVDLYRVAGGDPFSLELLGSWKVDTQQIRDVYGFCFALPGSSAFFVCGKNGLLALVSFFRNAEGTVEFRFKDSCRFASQTEGLVADPVSGMLYVSEEDEGIWRIPLVGTSGLSPQRVEMSGPENPRVVADLEGLACYHHPEGHYLLASVQGNFSYAVFEGMPPNRYLGSFRIADGAMVDGVEETDGIDAVSFPLGAAYPEGLFFAQDGFNFDSCRYRKQNFKLVDFRKIRKVIGRMGQLRRSGE